MERRVWPHVGSDTVGQPERAVCTAWRLPGATDVKPTKKHTHVDLGFAHYRYAIFVLHRFASREWDAEVREYDSLWRRKEIVCDESHSFDGGVHSKVVAHG